MDKQEVYNLLDNSWIYIQINDNNDMDYFKNLILKSLNKKDLKYYDNRLFIKKSEKLFNIFKNIGMDTSNYDATIIISFKIIDNNKLKFDFYSLKNAETLDNISEKIINKIY